MKIIAICLSFFLLGSLLFSITLISEADGSVTRIFKLFSGLSKNHFKTTATEEVKKLTIRMAAEGPKNMLIEAYSSNNPHDYIAAFIIEGADNLSKKKFDVATKNFDSAIILDPKNLMAIHGKILSLIYQNDCVEIKNFLEQVSGLEKDTLLIILEVESLRLCDEYDNVESTLNQYLKTNSNDYELLLYAAIINQDRLNFTNAKKFLQLIVEQEPNLEIAHEIISLDLEMGSFDDVSFYDKLLQIHPKDELINAYVSEVKVLINSRNNSENENTIFLDSHKTNLYEDQKYNIAFYYHDDWNKNELFPKKTKSGNTVIQKFELYCECEDPVNLVLIKYNYTKNYFDIISSAMNFEDLNHLKKPNGIQFKNMIKYEDNVTLQTEIRKNLTTDLTIYQKIYDDGQSYSLIMESNKYDFMQKVRLYQIGNSFEIVKKPPVPLWVKNNAGWWADNKIDDNSFVEGIQFLIREGIITVN